MIEEPKEFAYPSLNVYASSRVSNQKVHNTKIPLLRYKQAITANNCRQNYDAEIVDVNFLRKFEPKDGLLYSVKNMRNQLPEIKRMKILICVCMYNEGKQAINLTLNGIYENLANMRSKGITDGDIAVVLIQDGILKLVSDRQSRTYAQDQQSMIKFYEKLDKRDGKKKCDLVERINIILDEIENYDRRGMKSNVARNRDFPPSIEKNIALVYQNLWKPSYTYFPTNREGETRPVDSSESLHLFSCFKHTNGTKLSSHLLFFEGFCRYLKPQFCVLLDVGTKPDPFGLVNLIKGFSASPDIGGCTGFMSVDSNFKSLEGQKRQKSSKCECISNFFFSVEKAQQYEYIISHFIDKNAESALGFLHVLPGAWSAYRYDALIKSEKYEPNLLERSYFKMILNPDMQQKDFKEANMYLAQDRILSLGIYCQMDSKYLLKYVPDAIAYTDPMKSHQTLMVQRRRWINSSLFAFEYVFKNYYFNVMESKHNFFRKYITLNISMLLALLSTFNTYITPSVYFFVMYATIYQLGFTGAEWVAKIVTLLFTALFFSAVAGSLTGSSWTKKAYIVSMFFSAFTFLMIILVIFNVIFIYLRITKNPIADNPNVQPFDINNPTPVQLTILVLTVLNIGSFVLILLAHFIGLTHARFVGKLLWDTFSYTSYTGAYSQTMVIHGFCNIDDVSWGTKGNTGAGGVKKYEVDKVFFVSTWLFWNAVLAYIFVYVDIVTIQNQTTEEGGMVMIAIAIYGTSIICLKTLLALYYHFKWLIFQKCCLKLTDEPNRKERIDAYWRKQFERWNGEYRHIGLSMIHRSRGRVMR